MKNPNPDMLLRIAQGDAYCIACEFVDHPDFDEILKFKQYYSHPKYKAEPGRYTDDTQFSIGAAEALIFSSKQELLNKKTWAKYFFNAFKRDPINGYSRGFQKILETSENLDEFIKNINPVSDRNGAAMRSVPLGVLPNIIDIMKVASVQASVTHNTFGGIISSVAVALMSHYALYFDYPLIEVNDFLSSCLGDTLDNKDQFNNLWEGRVAGDNIGMKTAQAVCSLLRTENTMLQIMRKTLMWGGDTDSVAAIAMGIASARMKDQLPRFMEEKLEVGRGVFGVNGLKSVGTLLMNRYK